MQRKANPTKISAALLGIVLCFTLAACSRERSEKKEEYPMNPEIKASQAKNFPVNNDSNLSSSFAYANSIANTVQGFYTDGSRCAYALQNLTMSLIHNLDGTSRTVTIANPNGVPYAEHTLDVYVKDVDGNAYYAGNSASGGRVNTTRLGYYYYETHVRDLGFGISGGSVPYLNEKKIPVAEGWQTNQMSNPAYSDGSFCVIAEKSEDPYVYKTGFEVEASAYNAIEVELKAEGNAVDGQLYFCTAATGGFNAAQYTSFSVKSDGEYHTYLIDLTAAGLDGAALTGVRFDLGAAAGDRFTIRSVKAVQTDYKGIGYKLDKTFHVYADKLHQEYRLAKINGRDASLYEFSEFGVELKLPKEKVVQYKAEYEADGVTPVYAAAELKDIGVIGLIFPADSALCVLSVCEEDGFIVMRQSTSEQCFGSRIYNDPGHDFSGIAQAAFEERHPLTKLSVAGNSVSQDRYVAYDALRGAYRFVMDGTDFSTAYYQAPNKYYTSDISIENDGDSERSVYIWMNGTSGCLECAAVADSEGRIVPLPTQVCKNFQGEIEEPFYDPEDIGYGDSFIPLKIGAGETLDYTLYHLYQNWGRFPLKQLSSIQFHISYYHLSTGATESNCIAPYFVYGKDQWTLPDFRGCSGTIWSGQPQYNSVGRLRFVSYQKNEKKFGAEYTRSEIRSSGTSYADLDYCYRSECGSYEYTLRHVEFPQNDENRTYYTMRLDFLQDLTIEDVKNNLTLFSFDGRSEVFHKMSFTNESGVRTEKDIELTEGFRELINIGGGTPFFSYYGLENKQTNIMNFAYILRRSDIVIGGERWNGAFVLRNSFTGGLNLGELSLLEDTLHFRKGDYIELSFILLPWGKGTDRTDTNVQSVIEDSVRNPLALTAGKGSIVPDALLPEIRAEQNEAEFTLSGGRNRFAVCVDGMTSLNGIEIKELTDSGWKRYRTNVTDFDGYQIIYREDGTYSYVFIVDMDQTGSPRTFRVTAK